MSVSEVKCQKIFRSLDPKFDHVVVTTMTMEELLAMLEIHEQRINKSLCSMEQEEALQVKLTFRRNVEEWGIHKELEERGRVHGQAVGLTRGGRGPEEYV